MTVWRHRTFWQLAERDTGVRGVGNGGNAVGGEDPLGCSAGSRKQGSPIRRVGLGAQPDGPRRRREMCLLPLPQRPAITLGGDALDARGGEVEIVDAHGPYLESVEGGQGVIHASLPVDSELFSIITSAQSASAGWSNEAPTRPFGSIALTSEWSRSQPPFWPARRLSQ